MCIAIPMQVIALRGRKAQVQGQDHTHWVDTQLLAGLKKGDWLLGHGDLAIQKLDKKTALEMIGLQKKINL